MRGWAVTSATSSRYVPLLPSLLPSLPPCFPFLNFCAHISPLPSPSLQSFIIPDSLEWPESLRGMALGQKLAYLRSRSGILNDHPDKKQTLQKLGTCPPSLPPPVSSAYSPIFTPSLPPSLPPSLTQASSSPPAKPRTRKNSSSSSWR